MPESNLVFVGIPLTEEGAVSTSSPLSESKSNHSITTCGGFGGLFAFIVGTLLACFAWIANQGWTIASLLVFGQFAWTLEAAWKHVLLCLFGSFCTAVAFWAVFRLIFPEVKEEEDEDDSPSFQNDVSNALSDLGELGFVVGYFSSQVFLTKWVYDPFTELGLKYEELNGPLSISTLVILIIWMFTSKMRDFGRALARQRASRVDSSVGDPAGSYAQVV